MGANQRIQSLTTSTAGAIVLTVAGFFVALYLGATPAVILFEIIYDLPFFRANHVLGGIGVTLLSIFLLYVIRNRVNGQQWEGLGITVQWRAISGVFTGFVLAASGMVLVNIIAVEFGPATWRPRAAIEADLLLQVLIISLLATLLVEAIPEELWFRGHLFDSLTENHSLVGVIVLTSVVFGSFHLLSQPPTGVEQQVIWAVMAIAFGFALVMCRVVTGAIWMAIGFHAGHNTIMHLLVDLRELDDYSYGVVLVVWTAVLLILGTVLLLYQSRRGR